jgi:hypothetical protein
MFDPHDIIENYFKDHPKLDNMYHFNGLWKPEPISEHQDMERIIVMLS